MATIIGIFAGICAYFIEPLSYLMFGLSILGHIYLYKKKLLPGAWSKSKTVFFLILATIIFHFNDPQTHLFEHHDEKIIYRFDQHYTYYSSPSIEMKLANYFSRLRNS